MDPEQIGCDLEVLLQEAEAEQATLNELMTVVSAELLKLARRHYPGLGELDPQGLRELGHLLSRTSCRFAMDLDQLSAASAKRQEAEPQADGRAARQDARKAEAGS